MYPKGQPKKRMTKPRASQEREYRAKRLIFLEANPTCNVWSGPLNNCTLIATEVHHKKGRIGDLLTDERYFLAVCRNCHQYIENNPEWAKEQGYSLNRFTKPCLVSCNDSECDTNGCKNVG